MHLTERQVQKLRREILDGDDNPAFVVIDDGHSVTQLIEVLTGVVVEASDRITAGVAHFRLSSYLPSGEALIERIREVPGAARWIVVHVDCTSCPPAFLVLGRHMVQQRFDVPRIVIVVERLDLACANTYLRELFALGTPVDLTDERTREYYLQLAQARAPTLAQGPALAEFHWRLQERPVSEESKSLRRLDRALKAAAGLSGHAAADVARLVYAEGCEPGSSEQRILTQLIGEVFG